MIQKLLVMFMATKPQNSSNDTSLSVTECLLNSAGFLIVQREIGRSIRINSQELADFVNAEFADIKE